MAFAKQPDIKNGTGAASLSYVKSVKAIEVELALNSTELKKQKDIVVLQMLENVSDKCVKGRESFYISLGRDLPGIEDTKINIGPDAERQNNKRAGRGVQLFTVNKYKTVPGYFSDIVDKHMTIESWVEKFLSDRHIVVAQHLEEQAVLTLRSIAPNTKKADPYIRLGASNMAAEANSVLSKANVKAGYLAMRAVQPWKKPELKLVISHEMADELPNIFNLYDEKASAGLGDQAKTNGFIGKILGFDVHVADYLNPKEAFMFHPSAVVFGLSQAATLSHQSIATENQEYFGLNIIYGIMARSDKRAVVFGEAEKSAAV